MNAFSAFAAALCAACVLIGALHLITPDGAMSKPVKYALSVVFLISVISAAAIPLKKISVDITVPDCVRNIRRKACMQPPPSMFTVGF